MIALFARRWPKNSTVLRPVETGSESCWTGVAAVCYRTSRLKGSFLHQAVSRLNSLPALNTLEGVPVEVPEHPAAQRKSNQGGRRTSVSLR